MTVVVVIGRARSSGNRSGNMKKLRGSCRSSGSSSSSSSSREEVVAVIAIVLV